MRQKLPIFILFLSALMLGLWFGSLLSPENSQLTGTLSVLESSAPTGTSQIGDYAVEWNNANGGQLTVRNTQGKILWQTLAGEPFVMAAQGNEHVTESRGMFKFRDNWQVVCTDQTVDLILQNKPGTMTLSGHVYCNDNSSVLYNIDFEESNNYPFLSMSIWLQNPETFQQSNQFDRIFLTYASSPDEHFFGFGEQFTYFDMKGKKIPIWVSEQGVGRGEQPLTFLADLTNGGAGGNALTSYAPMPFYITNQSQGIFVSSRNYSQFDFTRPRQVQILNYAGYMNISFFNGATPAEALSIFTADKRMQPLPEWVYASAIIGMQGGTDKVREVYDKLQQRNMPMTAFWLQDWVGQRKTSFGKQLWWNWEVDYDRYPGWDQLVSDLNKDGVEVMVYASPYLADIGDLKPNMRRNLFQEAKEKGYLVKNDAGEPYLVLNTDFYFGMIDLTNPEARDWYKKVLEEQVVASGAKGWMADFGESLPYDAVLQQGTGKDLHNIYPVLWSILNRDVVAEANDDLVFFNRAAYITSPGYATLFWEGDQLVDWSAEDGIKSAVTGLNTGGLSGMAYNHSDIGGYTTITNPLLNKHRSRELLYRWMEMNAFTLIFRTHEGNQPEQNIQFYTDDETLDTFAYWAKVYAALFEYRKTLVAEAAQTGLPVVRHPFIHYPDDPETWKITYQEFMLGADFLVAPVTDEGAASVTAYLPQGEWVHLWSGKSYTGGQSVTVAAPIRQPGVFYKKGSKWGEELIQELEAQGLMP